MTTCDTPKSGAARARATAPQPATDVAVESFLRHLLDPTSPSRDLERRQNQRHPLSVTLTVRPLDADLQHAGEEFRVITRDVSAGGIGFVHTEPVTHKLLRVRMPDRDQTEVLAEVRHCTKVGELGLLYLVGAQLVAG